MATAFNVMGPDGFSAEHFELLPPSEVPPPDVDIMSSRAECFRLLEFDVLVEVIVDWKHGGG